MPGSESVQAKKLQKAMSHATLNGMMVAKKSRSSDSLEGEIIIKEEGSFQRKLDSSDEEAAVAADRTRGKQCTRGSKSSGADSSLGSRTYLNNLSLRPVS